MLKKIQSLISGNKSSEGRVAIPLTLSIARSQRDLESAFKLLFQCRSEKEWTAFDFRDMRVSPYHLLPTTTLITAYSHEKLVGTISIVKEGPFGLPSFNEDLRSYGRCAEWVELAVSSDYPESSGFLRDQLRAFAAAYAVDYMELETVLIREKTKIVYKRDQLKKIASQLSPGVEVQWPERPYLKTLDPVLNASSMDFFFGTRSSIFQRFSLQQKVRALLLFRGSPFVDRVRKILDIEDAPDFSIQRASSRFETLLKGKVLGEGGKSFEALITTVSRKGLALVLPPVVDQEFFRKITEVQVQLKDDLWCCLQVKPVSFQNFRGVERGFEIIDADKIWFSYISYLTTEFFPEEDHQSQSA